MTQNGGTLSSLTTLPLLLLEQLVVLSIVVSRLFGVTFVRVFVDLVCLPIIL